jgi:hypothetical protein
MPAATTLRGGDAIPVEPIGDRLERRSSSTLPAHPLDDRIRQHRRATEPDPLGALDRERLLRTLADEPTFELTEGGHDVDHGLAARRARVHPEIERDQGPALAGRAVHQGGEVHHRPG